MLTAGILNLPWWGLVIITLALTHVTIAAVTLFLHRGQAHRAVDFHPAVSHFFRFWLWLTTSMTTKEWVAIHRKHHAKVDTADDPHSPQTHGLLKVLFAGVFLYVKETYNTDTLQRFGAGTPDDWVERNLYTAHPFTGLVFMALLDIGFFGLIPGALIFITQILWIPLWAAGVVNGVGHFFGYRNFDAADASRNLLPWGLLIGGEELHNNHHAHPTSAKLSFRSHEFDIGWMYIQILSFFGLATVKKRAMRPVKVLPVTVCDAGNLRAIAAHRYSVLREYAGVFRAAARAELAKHEARKLRGIWMRLNSADLREREAAKIQAAYQNSTMLATVGTLRKDLCSLWEDVSASEAQLLERLNMWCKQAEATGFVPLRKFSLSLRQYA